MRIFDPNTYERKRIIVQKKIATLFVFQSDSNAAVQYQTLQYVDGTMSCDCKGWVFKRRGTPDGERSCKHTRFVQAGLGNIHAARVVEYAAVTAAPRVPQRAFTQQDLAARRPGRVFDLDEE